MTWSAAQIERVVREVLAELGLDGPNAAREPTAGDRGQRSDEHANPPARPADLNPCPSPKETRENRSTESPQSQPQNGELVCARQVVCLGDLEGRLEGVRRLVVPAGAVVTPAVRDELARRGVALAYSAAEQRPEAGLRLAAIVVARRFDVAPLAAAVQRDGVAVEHAQLDCLIAATDRLARELAGGATLGLLVTRHTAMGLCLANRHRTIRAILGREPVELAADAQAVGANLLVVDPYGSGLSVLIRLVREFCAGGVRECPEALQRGLA